jgi:NAD(P)-dependent dehydrogenase (short-subunit alcohol dehydrogenase family)
MGQIVVISGGSSGIGKSAAALFARNAYTVYELSRTGRSENGVTHITADVTRSEEVKTAFAEIFRREGRLDILVNNAGMGISGAVEFTEEAQARRIFDVNFFGTFLCCREALPYLRQTPGARIINLSSAAAPLPIPFQAFYSATKAAVNAMTLALANELRPFGIRVCAIMPGDTRTGFTAAREKSEAGETIYGQTIRRAVSAMERDELSGMSPDRVAAAVLRAARKKRPKVLHTAGSKYRFFVMAAKILPSTLCNWLVGQLYS